MDNSVQRTALVTGAAGFLGRHLCRELASQGWFVVGMGHGEYDSGEAKAWGISDWIRADITVENLLRSPVRPIAIFHCAGSGSVAASMQNPLFDFRRTVETTASVLDFARLCFPQVRVSTGVCPRCQLRRIRSLLRCRPMDSTRCSLNSCANPTESISGSLQLGLGFFQFTEGVKRSSFSGMPIRRLPQEMLHLRAPEVNPGIGCTSTTQSDS
jgi:hypothetical protein